MTTPTTQESSNERDMSLGEPGFWQKLFRRKSLEGFFLFVTSKCNSRCRTCFNHGNLNRDDDMTFDQIKSLSETAGYFDKLWLSGGEPFLRKELVDIIVMFVRNNGIKSINLPTNGLSKDKVITMTGEILERCPNLAVYLNFSLDGLGKTHDAIRGVPGNFRRTTATMDAVHETYGDNPNLYINVATVVTREGYDEVLPLASYIEAKQCTDLHLFETLRGDPLDPELKALSLEEVQEMHKRLYPVLDKDANKLFKDFKGVKAKIARMSYMGIMNLMFRLKEENLFGPSPWGMKCTAGTTTLVLDANGDFRACEMRPPIGNMKDYDYDVKAVYKSDAMKNEIKAIGGGKTANCWCTHGCWITSSLKFSPKTMLGRVPKLAKEYEALAARGDVLPPVDVAAIEAYEDKDLAV